MSPWYVTINSALHSHNLIAAQSTTRKWKVGPSKNIKVCFVLGISWGCACLRKEHIFSHQIFRCLNLSWSVWSSWMRWPSKWLPLLMAGIMNSVFAKKKMSFKNSQGRFFVSIFSTQEQHGFTVSSIISLSHTCSFHDSIICIVWNIIFVRESRYLYMICGQDSFFVRQLTFSPDNNVATFIYSTGGASKTGQMKEVAEGLI